MTYSFEKLRIFSKMKLLIIFLCLILSISIFYMIFFIEKDKTIDLKSKSKKQVNEVSSDNNNKSDSNEKIEEFIDKNVLATANNIIFNGRSKDDNPFNIHAKNVQKLSEGDYKIFGIESLISIDYGSLKITSDNALFNKKENEIIFETPTQLFLDDNYLIGDKFKIDLYNKIINANGNIDLRSKNFEVTSDEFQAIDDKQIIRFKGNVRTNISFD